MSVKIDPENLKTAARLAAQVKTTKDMKSRSSQWNGLHRLLSSGGRLWLLTTDGSTFLEWNIPTKGEATTQFDVAIEAGKFNDVVPRLSDGDPIELSAQNGFLSLSQGTRVLRLPLQPTGAYPSPEDGAEAPATTAVRWRTPSRPLAKSLTFISHFIAADSKTPGKNVATLGRDGRLRAGGPTRHGQVRGMDTPPSPLNFETETVGKVASYLTAIGEVAEITADGTRYTFACPERAHKLVIRGGSQSFPDTFEGPAVPDYEMLRVDRKALEFGMALIATLVPEKEKPLEFRIRGSQNVASIRLSTPGQVESEKSNAEIPTIRNFPEHGDDPGHEGDASTGHPADTTLKVRSESLRDIVSKLEGESLILKFFPRTKFLLIEEDSLNRSGPFRSVLTTVGLLGTHPLAPIEATSTPSLDEEHESGQADGQADDGCLVAVGGPPEPSSNGTGGRSTGTR